MRMNKINYQLALDKIIEENQKQRGLQTATADFIWKQ